MGRSVLIAAGGTGGHIYPGLALAEKFRAADFDVIWIGSKIGLESRIVPRSDIPFEAIPSRGLRGKNFLQQIWALFIFFSGFLFSVAIVLRIRPSLVVGMGGFVSAPVGLASWVCRCPLVIHEQNAVVGLANRILSRVAIRIFEAFPNSFPASLGAISIGNPIRDEIILARSEIKRKLIGVDIRLLVFGGSRGARILNELVPKALNTLENVRIKVLHQSGFEGFRETKNRYNATESHIDAIVRPFIDNMSDAYSESDLVICRSGAITVSEIATVGIGSILIPYRHAVDDHQTKNAEYLKSAGAAIVLPESELTQKSLGGTLRRLLEEKRHLNKMANAARRLGHAEAASRIVNRCLDLCR